MYFSLKVRKKERQKDESKLETKWEVALRFFTGQGKTFKEHLQVILKTPIRDTFYLSKRWRDLRYKVIQRNGGVCQACKVPGKAIHVDHIKPRSKHPTLQWDIENLQVLCAECNIGKGNQDDTDWR